MLNVERTLETMECCYKAISKRFAIALAGFILVVSSQAEEEASDVYLLNVVNELQLINGPSPTDYYYDYDNGKGRNGVVGFGKQPPTTSLHQGISPPINEQEQLNYLTSSKFYEAKSPLHIASFPGASPVPPQRSSTILGFSPAQLASMYRQALERGTLLNYNTLINTMNEQTPKVTSVSDFQFTDSNDDKYHHTGESQYAYYFYPLQTFRHELLNQYGGYKTLPDAAVSQNKPSKETSTTNPIIIGIGSFLGMLLFFALSLFFYPRFLQYTSFPLSATSRTIFQSDLEHLAIFVIEAIDYYERSVQLVNKK